MATIAIPFLVMVLGAVVHVVSSSKASELGRIAFFVGLFWTVYAASHAVVHFG